MPSSDLGPRTSHIPVHIPRSPLCPFPSAQTFLPIPVNSKVTVEEHIDIDPGILNRFQ
jgi:hypothetical protein